MRASCVVVIGVLAFGPWRSAEAQVDEPGLAAPASQPSSAKPSPPAPPRAAPARTPGAGWYYIVAWQVAGPVATSNLVVMARAGQLSPYTLVWQAGLANWQVLASLPELAGVWQATPVPESAPRGGRERIRGLVTGGAITLGVTWGLAVLGSIMLAGIDCIDCDPVSHVLWIPIAGPIVADVVDNSSVSIVTAAMVFWSVSQAAGAAMLVAGLVGRKRSATTIALDEWRVAPLVGAVNGVGVSHRF